MNTVTFYGASDDLIEVDGCEGAGEFNAGNCEPVAARFLLHGTFGEDSGTESLAVYALYDGVWSFAVGQADEDTPLPAWPISIVQSPEVPYSALLTIVVPGSARLERVAL